MKKTYSIVMLPLNTVEKQENQSCVIDSGFETELEAENALSNSHILEIAEGESYIVAIVPCYGLLQAQPA